MRLSFDTPLGKYKYKFVPVFNGRKLINKEIAKENLLLFKKIADKNGLRFGLMYGTFLGCMREHDFIYHDEDIDLSVLREDLDIVKRTIWEAREYGFEVIRYDRCDWLCSIMRKGEYIDLYIYEPLVDGLRHFWFEPIPEKFVTELEYYDFQGDKFLGPKDGLEFVEFFYGPKWNVPIVTNDYKLSALRKFYSKARWVVYYTIPDFMVKVFLKKRRLRKVSWYNAKVRRYNEYKGNDIYPLYLPKGYMQK